MMIYPNRMNDQEYITYLEECISILKKENFELNKEIGRILDMQYKSVMNDVGSMLSAILSTNENKK